MIGFWVKGGGGHVVWMTDQAFIYELSFADFTSVRSSSASYNGIGGDEGAVWVCDTMGVLKELAPTDFSTVQSRSVGGDNYYGIGGTSSTVWATEVIGDILELSSTDLTEIRAATDPGAVGHGIGGSNSVIWHSDDDNVYELDEFDLSSLRTAASPATFEQAYGAGGSNGVFYHTDKNTADIFELAVSDFSTVRSVDFGTNTPHDIGGT